MKKYQKLKSSYNPDSFQADIAKVLELAESILKILQRMEITLNEDRVAHLEGRLEKMLQK